MAHSRAEEVCLALTNTFDFTTRNGNATTTYAIRVVPLEGNPWFVLADAAAACGLTPDTKARGVSYYNALRGLPAGLYRTLNKGHSSHEGLFKGTSY